MPKGKIDWSGRTTIQDFEAAHAARYHRETARIAAQNYLAHTEWLVILASRGGEAVPPEVVHARALAEAELKES